MTSQSCYEVELRNAIDIAIAAGKVVKLAFEGMSHKLEYKDKLEADLVTETDIAVQKMIETFLMERHPTYKFIGEESVNEYKNFKSNSFWIVDPIDGTTNFAHGIPFTCISIGLCTNGVPVLGVVYNAITGELFHGVLGHGAFHNNARMPQISRPFDTMIGKLIGAEYGNSRNTDAYQPQLQMMENLLKFQVRGIRSLGSAALNICYVAKGSLDAFFEVGIHCWDVCAAAVILQETGGLRYGFFEQFDLFSGRYLFIRGCESAKQHDYVVTMFKDILKDVKVKRDDE